MRCCKDIDVDNTYHVMIIIIKLTCKSVFEALLPPSSLILIIIIIIILILINFQGSVCGSIATAATRPSALPVQTLNTGSMALSGNNEDDEDKDNDDNEDEDEDDNEDSEVEDNEYEVEVSKPLAET